MSISNGNAWIYSLWLSLAAMSWANEWPPFQNKITAYNVMCTEERNDVCYGVELTGSRTTYRADKISQTVTYWREDNRPQKYSDCAIIDLENWSCQLNEPDLTRITLEMIDGIFLKPHATNFFVPLDPLVVTALTGGAYGVSKWHWWRVYLPELSIKFKNFLKKYTRFR